MAAERSDDSAFEAAWAAHVTPESNNAVGWFTRVGHNSPMVDCRHPLCLKFWTLKRRYELGSDVYRAQVDRSFWRDIQ